MDEQPDEQDQSLEAQVAALQKRTEDNANRIRYLEDRLQHSRKDDAAEIHTKADAEAVDQALSRIRYLKERLERFQQIEDDNKKIIRMFTAQSEAEMETLLAALHKPRDERVVAIKALMAALQKREIEESNLWEGSKKLRMTSERTDGSAAEKADGRAAENGRAAQKADGSAAEI